MNWVELPDLAAVALLAGAFVSVARKNRTRVSRVWLIGWLMIVLHFLAFLFLNSPGIAGFLGALLGVITLTWAGLLFTWASIPYSSKRSSQIILVALLAVNALYLTLIQIGPLASWALTPTAALFGLLPLGVGLGTIRKLNHPLRWTIVLLNCGLSAFLLLFQHRPGSGPDLAENSVIFTVYLACAIHFWFAYMRASAGAIVTISGFFAWAAVFVVAPTMQAFAPQVQVESEVWNLPKYLVALGMILLLLEDQIEHNRHLALHDHLTGLPNRRLFQDRLMSALDRARRNQESAALLLLDLDHFKEVNDTLGHHVGDMLLQRVATVLSGRVRRSDTVARTGGDEFSVILEAPTSRDDASAVGRILVELLSERMELAGKKVQVGASVGVALYPDDASDLEALCIAADLRMYANKNGSRIAAEVAPSASPRQFPSQGTGVKAEMQATPQ